MYTEFTRNTETELVSVQDIATLTLGSTITVNGLRPGNEGDGPWDLVRLYAWSDPDGDGVYDQQLLTYTSNLDNLVAVPLSKTGPFYYYEINLQDIYCAIYRLNANICGPDTLTRKQDRTRFPSSVSLSAELLTRLFGPNTLIRLDVTAQGEDSANPSETVSFYCLIPEGQTVSPAFTDVPQWCAAAVDWAVAENITQGMGDGKFEPGASCTNAMILTFLWRAQGEPKASSTAPITVDPYYQDAINWAYETYMIDASFDPDAYCTRASAVNYIYRSAFYIFSSGHSSFSDVPGNAPYINAVDWAASHGVTNGTGNGMFSPDKICNRGEIITFLYRAYVPDARLK